jgi:K+-transporting ATPase ATPase B chain
MTSGRSTVLPSSESVSTTDGAARQRSTSPVRRVGAGLLDPKLLWRSLPDAFRKLDPRTLWRSPVMFVVEIGSIFTTVLAVLQPSLFAWAITIWLWLTVLFANLAEAVAEGRGKAQAATLRRARQETAARRLLDWSPGAVSVEEEDVPANALQLGDVVVVEAGQVIPGDGDVVDGIAMVDESVITGESAPVIRESGGDRSAVTGGTRVLSDRIVVRITQQPGESFIDRMIALVEGANRQKTPNEIALNILLAALTILFLLAVATLQPLAIYSKNVQAAAPDSTVLDTHGVTGIVLVSLLVCLIPTTIGALLSAIGIAGMDRLVQRNFLAVSGRAVEAAGHVNTLLLDKTGTITLGNRQASEFIPVGGADEVELADAAQLSSLADETRRDALSLCWPRNATGCARGSRASWRQPLGSRSALRRVGPGSTCPPGRLMVRSFGSARVRLLPFWPGCERTAADPAMAWVRLWTGSARPAARRWWLPPSATANRRAPSE